MLWRDACEEISSTSQQSQQQRARKKHEAKSTTRRWWCIAAKQQRRTRHWTWNVRDQLQHPIDIIYNNSSLCCCCFLRRIYIDSIDREELFFLPFCARPPHYSPYLDQNDNDYLRLTAAAAAARPVWLTTLCIHIFSLNCNKTSHSEERREFEEEKYFSTQEKLLHRPEKRWEQLELAIVGAFGFSFFSARLHFCRVLLCSRVKYEFSMLHFPFSSSAAVGWMEFVVVRVAAKCL